MNLFHHYFLMYIHNLECKKQRIKHPPFVSSTELIESIIFSPLRHSSWVDFASNRISRSCHMNSICAKPDVMRWWCDANVNAVFWNSGDALLSMFLFFIAVMQWSVGCWSWVELSWVDSTQLQLIESECQGINTSSSYTQYTNTCDK